mmetsp:Transcript_4110/g.8027  ORF Transcript_4110/g.8027 Transcript_4110/m.8027 type:complete len:203 (+) Transcript_4110:1754-2362(+)
MGSSSWGASFTHDMKPLTTLNADMRTRGWFKAVPPALLTISNRAVTRPSTSCSSSFSCLFSTDVRLGCSSPPIAPIKNKAASAMFHATLGWSEAKGTSSELLPRSELIPKHRSLTPLLYRSNSSSSMMLSSQVVKSSGKEMLRSSALISFSISGLAKCSGLILSCTSCEASQKSSAVSATFLSSCSVHTSINSARGVIKLES